jgi:hypothetical protein
MAAHVRTVDIPEPDRRERARGFWASIEKDIGSFEDFEDFEDFGDVDLDEVTPLSLAVLQMCIDAYIEGLPAHD